MNVCVCPSVTLAGARGVTTTPRCRHEFIKSYRDAAFYTCVQNVHFEVFNVTLFLNFSDVVKYRVLDDLMR